MERTPATAAPGRRARRQARQLRHRKRWRLLLALTALSALVAFSNLAWRNYTPAPEPEIYFEASFARAPEGWTGLDAAWVESEGIVRLAYRQYAAPHYMCALPEDEEFHRVYVWHLPVRVSGFTDEALVLGALVFPQGPLALLVHRDGQLGLARDLFAPPVYSTGLTGRLTYDEWQDIYVRVDGKQEGVTVYLGTRRVLTEAWTGPTFPVQEIWLGALWLKGAGNYGIPLDVAYRGTTLGNDGLLRPSFPTLALDRLLGWLISGWEGLRGLLP